MSDHFSGPRALAGPAGDIADFYAFPSPNEDKLVLVMNVSPLATAQTMFSDAIAYRFRLRPVTIEGSGVDTLFPFGTEEIAFTLTFDEPGVSSDGSRMAQRGQCVSSRGASIAVMVNDSSGAIGADFGVFAGLRSDPFFFDLPAWQKSVALGELAFQTVGSNSLQGRDVLSIVMETDISSLLEMQRGPLFAAVSETVVAGKLPVRLERVGRPEIKNVLLAPNAGDLANPRLELRDLYNLEDPFHMSKDYREAYRSRISSNLAFLDNLDGSQEWQLDDHGHHPLTSLMQSDYLVVDISKPFSETSFLEIERSVLNGRPHATCGGRSLNEPAMDSWYSLFVNADRGPRVSVGLTSATVPAGDEFPYLAPPSLAAPESRPLASSGASKGEAR